MDRTTKERPSDKVVDALEELEIATAEPGPDFTESARLRIRSVCRELRAAREAVKIDPNDESEWTGNQVKEFIADRMEEARSG